jgi:outer membrane protein OmpA-like peptidoglycan-associated protein/tetratricopeptide (TPR) repeat protein
MKRHYLFILLLLFTFLPSTGMTQINEAKKEMALFNYSKAILLLHRKLSGENHDTTLEIVSSLAECYRKQNDNPNSIYWYKKAIACDPSNPDNFYFYAQALRSTADYSEARKMFLKFDSLSPSDIRGKLFAGYCDSAISWVKKDPGYFIKNVTALNTPQSDFGVVFYNNGILFSSDRLLTGNEEKIYGWTGNNYLRLFYSEPSISEAFTTDFKIPAPVEEWANPKGHNGPVSLSKIFDEVYINRTLSDQDKGRKNNEHIRTHLLKIFIVRKKDDNWSKPEPFYLNNDEYSVGHPALSSDGNSLFFVSDMPGGFGGTDLYFCRRDAGKWSHPVNLGNEINSSGNEMFPFISESGDLWFSSDGLPGFGGLDLFVARKVNEKWESPVNPGSPLNSSYDDFSISSRVNDSSGYFSSNRPNGKGSDDIYHFKSLPPPLPHSPPSYVSGCVKEKSSLLPIQDAWVFLLNTNSAKVLILKSDQVGCFRTAIKKENNFSVKAMKSGYIADCFTFGFDTLNKQTESTIPRDLLLDRLEINKTYRVANIFYNFDKWNIRSDAKPSLDELVRIMKDNPVKIELGSHTDCRGSEGYNRILSQKRAESAVQYIISQGIDSSRIIAKGYGKSQLINKCNCTQGVQCTEAEHQANRRTEFKIITWTLDKSVQDFSTDRFKAGDVLDYNLFPDDFFSKCK